MQRYVPTVRTDIGEVRENCITSVGSCIRDHVSLFYPDAVMWYMMCSTSIDHVMIKDKYGFAIVKKSERKICTLYVYKEFRNSGHGLKLFEKCFAALGTRKPLLTVSEENHDMFAKLFAHYKFNLTCIANGMYRPGVNEYIYNGKLLHLVLTYNWYDETVKGSKRIEYREMTDRWRKIIWDKRSEYTHVRFARGYTSETTTFSVTDITIGSCPIDGWDKEYFRIHFK